MPAYNWKENTGTKYRWLVYGVPGVGKTTLAGMLKGKTYMLSLDKSFERIETWQNKEIWLIDPESPINDLYEFIKSFDPKEYDNLVIDNVSNLQKLWFIEMAKESKNGLDNQLKHYNEFTNWLIRFISKVFSYDVNILVTAWERQVKVTDPSGQEFEQYAPDLRDSARDYLMGNCDQVGRLIQKPNSGERGIILQGTVDTYAKNRLDSRKGCKVDEFFYYSENVEKDKGTK